MNARRAPEGVGEGHGADELGDLQIDGRTTGSTAVLATNVIRADGVRLDP